MDWFFVVWLCFMVGIIMFNFTDLGMNFRREYNAGEVLEDLGVIGNDSLKGSQELRLLRCKKDNEMYYVLELKRSSFIYRQYDWIKLSNDAVQNLRTLLK